MTSRKGRRDWSDTPELEGTTLVFPQHQFPPATVGTTDRNTTSHQPPIFVPSPQISVSEDYCLEQQSV